MLPLYLRLCVYLEESRQGQDLEPFLEHTKDSLYDIP
jgi:hypothetical protein